MKKIIYEFLMLVSKVISRFASYLIRNKSKLIKVGEQRNLYQLPSKRKMWLNKKGYIDNKLISEGIFESLSTNICNKLVKEGDVVIDIGANIGYYSIIFSDLIGPSGVVYAVEPTRHFREILYQNLEINELKNVKVISYGLSDNEINIEIDIGPSSATLHSPEGYDEVLKTELISLKTFENFINIEKIKKIDFIKIDIDGHEPIFFRSAWKLLAQFDAVILFEISHLHYLESGVTAWDFYDEIINNNYNIFHEHELRKIISKTDFLRSCGDFSKSCNVVISKREKLI
jgi:FkbM family methyltransferase